MVSIRLVYIALLMIGIVTGIGGAILVPPANQQCVFNRNELGPQGTYGQWWWNVYKCPDGTEQRELVAGPRG